MSDSEDTTSQNETTEAPVTTESEGASVTTATTTWSSVPPSEPSSDPVSPRDEPPIVTSAQPTIDQSAPKAGVSTGRVFVLLLIAALIGGLIGGVITRGTTKSTVTKVISSGAVKQVATTSNIKLVLKKVEPAVVSITTSSVGQGEVGAGTGMILKKDGEVLTNAHVVRGGNSFSVTLFDSKKQVPADLVGIDTQQDVALLKIRNAADLDLTPVVLGDSNAIEVGDPVVAIGNALALAGTPSVTTGIISAKNRSIDGGEEKLENLLQTDAAINFGNSGGPLVDLDGKVVGVNTATADPSQTQNIGFAIPINGVKPLLADLRKGKDNNNEALLGVTTETVDQDLRARYDAVDRDSGAMIDSVQPSSPASDLGLETFDVVTKLGTTTIRTSDDLVTAVRHHKPGEKVTVVWYRGSKRMSGTTQLVARTVGQQ